MTPASLQEQCHRYIEAHPHVVLGALTNDIYRPPSRHTTAAAVMTIPWDKYITDGVHIRVELPPHFDAAVVRAALDGTRTQRVHYYECYTSRNAEFVLNCVDWLYRDFTSTPPARVLLYRFCAVHETRSQAIDYISTLFRDRGFAVRTHRYIRWFDQGDSVPYYCMHVSPTDVNALCDEERV